MRTLLGRVVGVHHNSAQRNGKQLDVGCCITFEVKDGRTGRPSFIAVQCANPTLGAVGSVIAISLTEPWIGGERWVRAVGGGWGR
jgi:hypothetical protein